MMNEVDHQTLSRRHAQVRQMRGRLLDHRDPLVDIEHALLGGIDQNRDNHFVELSRGPFEDIDVAQCHRIEGTRANGAAHDACRRRCSGGTSSRAAARGTKR
jgi:hypothetical protein